MTDLWFVVMAAAPAAPAGKQSPQGMFSSVLLPMIIIFFIIYVLMLKPQRKKEKERREMLDTIKKGDKVVTIGGVHGVLVTVRETDVTLRVDDDKGVKVKMNRSAISRVLKEGAQEDEE